ncbi:NAD(P)-dependent dehydrogenase (short-subunit alcohol dehydrogenase family) [Sinobaca qinghaiensis]|uniref:NAD(P)-dependent dehydrogenase (Short-subunit alcohol dehydrogenase family) n=1 Tax=Sinobaca qinghaiensis TaxID=342944 RepID=A0A419V057_9BACL|nr:SDR family NAD(P)-dependent oxidoreductase [Sinobaca qinghaiensis]RKD71346.1 NAD(P)-dependent dehydrogenase (short-subunit alcohol dehydrogenase family) [Sinobaca qinghaiensis]
MSRILEGKAAVVTGSGQGIGRDIAICMADLGARVITNNRKPGSSLDAFEKTSLQFNDEEREALQKVKGDAQTTADEINRSGGEAIPFYGDVSDFKTAEKMVQTAVDHFGRIDIIVNNASSNWVGNIMKMDEELWDTSVASKLKGAFNLMHHALPYMKEQGFGRILNSSSDAFLGLEGYAAYGAANAGLVALSKAAAKDVAAHGITVNAYTPLAKTRAWYNAVATYRLQGVSKEQVEAVAPEAMKETAEGMVPFLAYLASDSADSISGYLFKLAANGEIGVWSDSEIISEIKQEEGVWTIGELEKRVPGELLKHLKESGSKLPLK